MSQDKENLSNAEVNELTWIKLRQDMFDDQIQNEETFKQKFMRKFNENPFVPIGCGLTAAALIYGLWSFRQGRADMSQKMMRVRIGAQGFTIAALMYGVGYAALNPQ